MIFKSRRKERKKRRLLSKLTKTQRAQAAVLVTLLKEECASDFKIGNTKFKGEVCYSNIHHYIKKHTGELNDDLCDLLILLLREDNYYVHS